MISFDDNSSGGTVDLSPIYRKLNILNYNTSTMWEFVSTLSGGSANPYLETYRSENELYMYNITGDLIDISNESCKLINGYYSVYSKSFNSLNTLSLKFVDTFEFNTFSSAGLVSVCGNWMGNNSFVYNVGLRISGGVMVDNTFENNGYVDITGFQFHHVLDSAVNGFASNKHVNVKCMQMKSVLFTSNTYVNLTCDMLSTGMVITLTNGNFNIADIEGMMLTVVQNANFNVNNIKTINAFEMSKLNMTGMELLTLLFDRINTVNVSALNISAITAQTVNLININCDELLGYDSGHKNTYISCTRCNISANLLNFNEMRLIEKCDMNINSLASFACSAVNHLSIDAVMADSLSLKECDFINFKCNTLAHLTCESIQEMKINLLSCANFVLNSDQIKGVGNKLSYGTLKACDLNITGDDYNNVSFSDIQGVISCDVMDSCTFSNCKNLMIYAKSFGGDNEMYKCWNVTVSGNTLNNALFNSVSSIKVEYKNLSGDGHVHFLNAYNLSYYIQNIDSYSIFPSSKPAFELKQGVNWFGKLYLESLPTFAVSTITNLQSMGISMTQSFNPTNCPIVIDKINGLY